MIEKITFTLILHGLAEHDDDDDVFLLEGKRNENQVSIKQRNAGIYTRGNRRIRSSICLLSCIYIFREVEIAKRRNIPTMREESSNDKKKAKRKHQSLAKGWRP
jgi:hypothetical protein